MKKLFTLLFVFASVLSIYAQKDTIFLASGKYYVCKIIDANPQYVRYFTAISKTRVDRIERKVNNNALQPDIIYLTNGSHIQCAVQKETNSIVSYTKNIGSKKVNSLHMNDGRVIYAKDFGSLPSKEKKKVSSQEELEQEAVVRSIFEEEYDMSQYDVLKMSDGSTRKGNVVAMSESVLKFIDVESDGKVETIPLIKIESINYPNGQTVIFEDAN